MRITKVSNVSNVVMEKAMQGARHTGRLTGRFPAKLRDKGNDTFGRASVTSKSVARMEDKACMSGVKQYTRMFPGKTYSFAILGRWKNHLVCWVCRGMRAETSWGGLAGIARRRHRRAAQRRAALTSQRGTLSALGER